MSRIGNTRANSTSCTPASFRLKKHIFFRSCRRITRSLPVKHRLHDRRTGIRRRIRIVKTTPNDYAYTDVFEIDVTVAVNLVAQKECPEMIDLDVSAAAVE